MLTRKVKSPPLMLSAVAVLVLAVPTLIGAELAEAMAFAIPAFIMGRKYSPDE